MLHLLSWRDNINLMRQVDFDLFKEKLDELGEGLDALIALRAKTGLSLSLIQKLSVGSYPNTPNKATRMILSRAFKLDENELFPIVTNKKKTAS